MNPKSAMADLQAGKSFPGIRGAQTASPELAAPAPSQEPTNHMASASTARVASHSNDPHFGGEDFATLLDETLGRDTGFDGSVVTGRVVRLTDEFAIVDVGLKSEGRVALRNSARPAPSRT
jgi:hypothetical protein